MTFGGKVLLCTKTAKLSCVIIYTYLLLLQIVIIYLRSYIYISIQLFIASVCYGQVDTSLYLTEIDIIDTIDQSTQLSLSPNTHTAHGSLNISKALSQQANIYVKNYGPASSSTISIRGGSANQALVTWDGIPINNPMLGVSDLSLIPSQLFGSVDVIKGGNSTTSGNGAITGVIDLSDFNHQHNDKAKLNLNIGIGSHGLRQVGVGGVISTNRFQFITKLHYADAKNDFNYKLDSGQERQNTHAQLNTKAWLQTISYSINANEKISLHAWLQDTYREIAPTTTQNSSEAVQHDKLNRYRLSYELNRSNTSFKTQLAYFDEDNIYDDPQIIIFNNNRFKRLIHKSDYVRDLSGGLIVNGATEYIYTQGESESYTENETLSSYALTARVKKSYLKNNIDLSARYERNSLDNSFLSTALQYQHHLSHKVSVLAKVSREYRFPTLNELFWTPGGNINLLSEHGWNQELNISYDPTKDSNLSLNLYHRLINDWILWSLIDGTNFFAPYNISKVRSYGAEIYYDKRINFNSWSLHIHAAYNYTVSKNINDISLPKINSGDQLFYIPLHQATLGLQCHFRDFKFNINGQYNSSTIGTLDTLGAYALINSSIEYTLDVGGQEFILSGVLSNITNSNYRIIERRPMMGRNFNLNINYKF